MNLQGNTNEPFVDSYHPADGSTPICELATGELLREAAADGADVVALIEAAPAGSPSLTNADRTDRRWTYGELLEDAEHAASWILERYQPGERVAVWAPNVPEWIIFQYGAALAGVILVAVNPALRQSELDYVLAQSGSSGIISTDKFRSVDMAALADVAAGQIPALHQTHSFTGWLDEVRSTPIRPLGDIDPGAAAQIQYTSGTTGQPKGALLHHRGLITNAYYVGQRLGTSHNGVLVSAMPLFHTAGCAMGVLGSAQSRSTYVLCQSFDVELVLASIESFGGTCLFGVPTMLLALLEHPKLDSFDLSSCEVAVSGGATVPAPLVRRIEDRLGVKMSTVYGQTELSPVVTQTAPDDSPDDKANTVGRPLWNVELKIVDTSTGGTLPCGETGEICARGFQSMLGYYEMPEATAATIDDDGWLHTGDLGAMDERGFFTVTGRLKDMLIRGGENIYPREIENVLEGYETVAEAVVVGLPDERWGETVAAIVRLSPGAEELKAGVLRDFVRDRLSSHKTPTSWYVVSEFPLTASGKVQKFALVEAIGRGELTKL